MFLEKNQCNRYGDSCRGRGLFERYYSVIEVDDTECVTKEQE